VYAVLVIVRVPTFVSVGAPLSPLEPEEPLDEPDDPLEPEEPLDEPDDPLEPSPEELPDAPDGASALLPEHASTEPRRKGAR
jgi:hypothetical protein